MNIQFKKMVGAGNDFIMINAQNNLDYVDFTKKVCDRHFGVGADGVIVLDKSDTSDYKMRILNADGSEAEMCGNGARCFAVYAANQNGGKEFTFETLAGQLVAQPEDEDTATIQLTDPVDYRPNIELKIGEQSLEAHYIDTGVPHAIIFVEGLHDFDVDGMGRIIRNHQAFAPRGTNVNFVENVRKGFVELRTYERGVEGETLACGTGSVAAALIGFVHQNPKIKEQEKATMKVVTASTEILDVTFDIKTEEDKVNITNVWLRGSAKTICEGEYYYV